VLSAYDMKTGTRHYPERVGTGGSYSASPVAGDGKIYMTSEDGDVYVVKAGTAYELLAHSTLGEVIMASPAVSEGTLYLRSLQKVWAISAAKN
ncbi:MAG TPA: PQQ-binding-like beta-propeller repeat protein, partial [Bryobacteraceae bacterium]|nr:PQQ-binding-like beta-propeller repeat protein [Bryobacteraceae bacterium]